MSSQGGAALALGYRVWAPLGQGIGGIWDERGNNVLALGYPLCAV